MKEGIGSFASVFTALGPVGPIHPVNPGLYRVQFENHGPSARLIADPRARLVPRTRDYGFQTGRGLVIDWAFQKAKFYP